MMTLTVITSLFRLLLSLVSRLRGPHLWKTNYTHLCFKRVQSGFCLVLLNIKIFSFSLHNIQVTSLLLFIFLPTLCDYIRYRRKQTFISFSRSANSKFHSVPRLRGVSGGSLAIVPWLFYLGRKSRRGSLPTSSLTV